MITVELDKYSEENYYKQPANSPIADSPDNVTHARLYYNTFAGSNYIQGDFVSGSNSTVEFDNTDVDYILFKLFTSTDGTTYTERKSFGGTVGKDCVTSQHLLNAKDITDWYLPVKKTQGGDDIIVFDSLSNIITGAGVTVSSTGVDYYTCRSVLTQHNSVNSGKMFFGSIAVDDQSGAYSASDIIPTGSNQTLADSWSKALSIKVGTGQYYLQFRTSSANNFITALAGAANSFKFDNFCRPIFAKRVITFDSESDPPYADDVTNELIGYLILDLKSEAGLGYYQDGRLYFETRDPDGVLTDNLLFAGMTIELKAYKFNE
jgi:hypothetical protein